MKFTSSNEGDTRVAKDLEEITKRAQEGSFQSLVLFGSFSKGEGMYWDGQARNDYDLILVGGNKKAKDALLQCDVINKIDLMLLETFDVKDIHPSQMWWEVSHGGILLAGKPLDLPLWEPWDIPYLDAVHSLDKRCVSLLVGKHEMMKSSPDWRKVIEQIDKAIIAVGDAILIKRGQFHQSYARRSLLLSADSIGPLYQLAVSTKTTGFPDLNPDRIWELWHEARNLLRAYIIENQLDVPKSQILFAVTDRTTKEELSQVLKKLGAERWI